MIQSINHHFFQANMRHFLHSLVALFLITCIHQATAADFKAIEQQISDTMITTKITTKFTKNKNLNPLKISVSTKNGIVTLRGHVKNKQAFVDALRATTSTKGVLSINASELEIKHVNTAFTDAYITAKIEAAILEAKVFDDESIPLVGINVSTVNGIVTLTGELKNDKAINAVLNRSKNVRGVKKIISKLHQKVN